MKYPPNRDPSTMADTYKPCTYCEEDYPGFIFEGNPCCYACYKKHDDARKKAEALKK